MNNYLYKILRKTKILPQKLFVKLHYKHFTGKELNLKDPRDFNEKIQWLKVYFKPAILNKLVDKYDVREYVTEKAGKQYLNEVYGVYETVEAIDFAALPKRFVLKATHGYNMNIVVRDKSKLNKEWAKETVAIWLKVNHYNAGMEWAYKDIKPRIIAENFLEEKDKSTINDYKFFCFDGNPMFLTVDFDRGNNHCKFYYDTEWNKLPFAKKGYSEGENGMDKPPRFEEMVEIAKKLSADFPFVRVDLYNINGEIVFGEMTFYPADGKTEFDPESYNRTLGDYIKLPRIPAGKKMITSLSQHVQPLRKASI
ncbi:ATP-grasp fold amidoligase family protein [Flavimarina sp. Hel_I_48]|uniref:ATP-grasp fold amidoligase family protein n=1 Tax=Flavimarina sp. Hel_I_48 TaxID=1392488 RepID=UPI00068E3B53|nr:ATP-grasp fold amidoligase family protein [Flavimarina sp. Hel_I_48]